MVNLEKISGKKNFSKVFARFLKENRLFVAYSRALANQKYMTWPECDSICKSFAKKGYRGDFLNEAFAYYRKTYHSKDYSIWLEPDKPFSTDDISSIINHSFTWDDSKEGWEFWEKIHSLANRKDSSLIPSKISYKEFVKLFGLEFP